MAAKKKAASSKKSARALKVVESVTPTPPALPDPPAKAKLANQEYQLLAIDKMRKHPKNPKKGNVAAIGDSVERNDFYGAVVVQKSTGFIVAGNHRYEAAVAKGFKEIPAIVIDMDDEKAERILLGDNRIAELGGYDDRALQALLEDRAKNGGLHGTGYDDTYLMKLQEKNKPPTTFPQLDEGGTKHVHTCPQCGFKWSAADAASSKG